jgi:hypothetical protein
MWIAAGWPVMLHSDVQSAGRSALGVGASFLGQ